MALQGFYNFFCSPPVRVVEGLPPVSRRENEGAQVPAGDRGAAGDPEVPALHRAAHPQNALRATGARCADKRPMVIIRRTCLQGPLTSWVYARRRTYHAMGSHIPGLEFPVDPELRVQVSSHGRGMRKIWMLMGYMNSWLTLIKL